ncbi:MAG: hypothetical protein CFE21_11640 [Bacteroidetes bacterium B1(2017)]|nr:MAG: hypothetical protein CFE21_11640 [Bacteroidetes bacterium B1(2017)]
MWFKMELNRTTYEAFLLDALEGNLSAAEQEEVRLFLSQNPDLQAEFELLQSVEPNALHIDLEETIDFSYLKKDSNTALTQEEFVAALEGDLNPAQQQDFDRKVRSNKELATEFSLFKQTKLIPTQVVFENKDSLKRKQARVIPMYMRIAAVAAVFLAILFFGWEVGTGRWALGGGQEATLRPLRQAQGDTRGERERERERERTSDPRPATLRQAQGPATRDPRPATLPQAQVPERVLQQIAIINQRPSYTKASAGEARNLPTARYQQLALLPATRDPLGDQRLATSDLPNTSDPRPATFLTPKQWLLNKLKAQLPEEALALNDTISNGGAGDVALNLIEKTTGIAYHDNTNSETGSRGFAIVSKYFAYEKITHP